MRIALGIEYLGSRYHGWQRQQGLSSVQESLESALSKIANQPIVVFAAGRTDAGVHATGQVVHFDSSIDRGESAWVFGTNTLLPGDIRVKWAKTVPESFHARFSATSRSYRYIIDNSRARSAILSQQLTWHPIPLDVEAMQKAGQYLLGEHDFTSFRGADCQAHSPVKTLMLCNVIQQKQLIILELKANGFLHHMVRNIAGVLVKVGEGKEQPEWALEVLKACDRRAAAKMLAANGLYLVEIGYPDNYELPSTLPGPAFLNIV
ncbi:MAG: truA [Gammaproteobacteria bacterium]|jgi:tRNA pseudouridine38-40 synthase|nr:truA [Gammaproteobacteria bacterium]